MRRGMTPVEVNAWRRALAERSFADELTVADLVELWDEREACAHEFGCAAINEAILRPEPDKCPNLCGALVYQLERAGFGEEWWS